MGGGRVSPRFKFKTPVRGPSWMGQVEVEVTDEVKVKVTVTVTLKV